MAFRARRNTATLVPTEVKARSCLRGADGNSLLVVRSSTALQPGTRTAAWRSDRLPTPPPTRAPPVPAFPWPPPHRDAPCYAWGALPALPMRVFTLPPSPDSSVYSSASISPEDPNSARPDGVSFHPYPYLEPFPREDEGSSSRSFGRHPHLVPLHSKSPPSSSSSPRRPVHKNTRARSFPQRAPPLSNLPRLPPASTFLPASPHEASPRRPPTTQPDQELPPPGRWPQRKETGQAAPLWNRRLGAVPNLAIVPQPLVDMARWERRALHHQAQMA